MVKFLLPAASVPGATAALVARSLVRVGAPMSAAQSRAVVERMAAKREELGAEDFGAYAFLAFGLFAWQAPEVVEFIFDRADERLAGDA